MRNAKHAWFLFGLFLLVGMPLATVAIGAEPGAEAGGDEEPVEAPAGEVPEGDGEAAEEGEELPVEAEEVMLGEQVVTATRRKGEIFRLTRFITLVDRESFRRMNLNVAVDALEYRIGTWVEHRTGSTGDAVVRGLSGGNLLALVDGCSLSSFWGEGGFAAYRDSGE